MRRWGLLCLGLALAPAGAWAHGEHPTGRPQGYTPPRAFDILSKAKAAARIEIDAANGARLIRADGLPDHSTGRFPGPGNPNAIAPQSYTLRGSLFQNSAVPGSNSTPLSAIPQGCTREGRIVPVFRGSSGTRSV